VIAYFQGAFNFLMQKLFSCYNWCAFENKLLCTKCLENLHEKRCFKKMRYDISLLIFWKALNSMQWSCSWM